MPKLSDFKMPSDEKEADNEVIERIERMMDDYFFEFALDNLERVWSYVQETDKIKDWMAKMLDDLEKYKEREEE